MSSLGRSFLNEPCYKPFKWDFTTNLVNKWWEPTKLNFWFKLSLWPFDFELWDFGTWNGEPCGLGTLAWPLHFDRWYYIFDRSLDINPLISDPLIMIPWYLTFDDWSFDIDLGILDLWYETLGNWTFDFEPLVYSLYIWTSDVWSEHFDLWYLYFDLDLDHLTFQYLPRHYLFTCCGVATTIALMHQCYVL